VNLLVDILIVSSSGLSVVVTCNCNTASLQWRISVYCHL